MNYKKTIYLACSVLLGIILSYIIHALIEIIYIKNASHITWHMHFGVGACALHPVIQYGLLIVGIVGGFFLGKYWWKVVYIEKRHWRFKKRS